MNAVYVISFIGFVAGLFLVFDITLLDFLQALVQPLRNRKPPLAARVRMARKPPKHGALWQLVFEVQEVLISTGRIHRVARLILLSMGLFIGGATLSLAIDNLFLLPVLSTGMALSPFIYILFTAGSFRKRLAGELESALSVITSSYLRSENIVHAVEENLPHLQPPVLEAFTNFVAQCRFVSADVSEALDDLEKRFSNVVFKEWVAAVKSCQQDRSLKVTLTSILTKLSDSRVVTGEVEVIMRQPLTNYVIMVFLLIGNVPLLWLINKSWFMVLVDTMPGKACLAMDILVIVVSMIGVVRSIRPVEFEK